ncbi:putative valine--tRNA ligase, cytoplasmic [Cucumispora dikerogammari]|nr:putative valine--tRNA ligase, cytoplasmic [Cucumispora dikerogammari]
MNNADDSNKTDRILRKQQSKQDKIDKLKKKLASLSVNPIQPRQIKYEEEEDFIKTETGKFKNMQDLKKYNPTYVEHGWYEWWEKMNFFSETSNCFHSKEPREKFVMILPPPNITGKLHIGHAMMLSIEDAIVRYNRLNGKEVVFVPGYDHAGIATQNVVEKTLERIQNEGFNKDDAFELKTEILLKQKGYLNCKTNLKNDLSTRKNALLCKKLDREILKEITFLWSDIYKSNILNQLKRLGASLDFNRTKFTMDASVNKLVEETFITLYEKSLIYRDYRLINWSCKLKTTLSDLEVNNIELNNICVYSNRVLNNLNDIKEVIKNGEESCIQGVIYKLRYPIIKKEGLVENTETINKREITRQDIRCLINIEPEIEPEYEHINQLYTIDEIKFEEAQSTKLFVEKSAEIEFIEVLTKRPETIFGDTALCYNPNDLRYKYLTDYYAINPLTLRVMPIIEDDLAQMDFGTGILKITPSSDFNDFIVYKKHKLEMIQTVGENGLIYKQNRFDARRSVIKFFNDSNMLLQVSKSPQILPTCSRSNCIVEPLPKRQWFMSMNETAKKTLEKNIEIIPSESTKTFNKWLIDTNDWCLSRQLWWGHQIPAYNVYIKENLGYKNLGWVVSKEEDLLRKINQVFNLAELDLSNIKYEKDSDVLDTWFSSGLWPFAVFDESERTKYFPNTLLETGNDIMFFWVARMCFLSIELYDKLPFEKVLLHGIVRDKEGRKMSKSLGNVIDPISIINGISLKELHESLSLTLNKKERKFAIDNQKKEFKEGIKKCGSDALRLSLVNMFSGIKDVNLDIKRVEGYRRYGNKLWNGMRCLKNIKPNHDPTLTSNILNNYIIKELNDTINDQHAYFKGLDLMKSSKKLYEFSYKFFDIFLELLKVFNSFENLFLGIRVYKKFVVMLSVYMPYLSEEIFQEMILLEDGLMKEDANLSKTFNKRDEREVSVSISRFPEVENVNEEEYILFNEMIKEAESVRGGKPFCDYKFFVFEKELRVLIKSKDVLFK